jgi:hypothetical protein
LSATEQQVGPGPSGPVLLELGAGAGAVVAYTEPDRLGQEIEIVPVDGTGRRLHAEVRPRSVLDGAVYAVVLGPVAPGRYRLFAPLDVPLGIVEVHAGRVSEVTI